MKNSRSWSTGLEFEKNHSSAPLRCPCEGTCLEMRFRYDRRPEGEISFEFNSDTIYSRQVLSCTLCGHFVSVHNMNAGDLYKESYVTANYRDEEGIRRTFERIISLPDSQSDNSGRVRRVLQFASEHFPLGTFGDRVPRVLDIGSGLGVFLYKMKGAGWDCTALDPDLRSAHHAETVVGITAICTDFLKAND